MQRGLIEIENLLGTKKLTFEFPEKPGVYLLVGPNGAGKSTLLACLAKLGDDDALRKAFPHNRGTDRIDAYNNARIHYKNSCGEVAYWKAPTRWNPDSQNKKDVLDGFGFPDVVYARVSPYRYSPRNDDMVEGETIKLSVFSGFLEQSLCEVFERDDYRNIEVLKNKAGRRWFKHFYICKNPDGSYYSEKVFSTGELAVLRLLGLLDKEINEGSLILIDEFDMALHPKAQSKLVEILEEQAKQKKLTVILATHSTSLISNSSPRNILYLDKRSNGETVVVNPCYASNAMRTVDIYRNILSDYLFLVEDNMARKCLDVMCRLARGSSSNAYGASYCIVPVGGFRDTAKLSENIAADIPSYVKVRAVLDGDAFDDTELERLESIDPADRTDEEKGALKHLAEWREFRNDLVKKGLVGDLGFTPEVQLIGIIEKVKPQDNLEKCIRDKFSRSLSDIVLSHGYMDYCKSLSKKNSSYYKKKYDYIVERLAKKDTTECKEQVALELIEVVLPFMDSSEIQKIVGKVFSEAGRKRK